MPFEKKIFFFFIYLIFFSIINYFQLKCTNKHKKVLIRRSSSENKIAFFLWCAVEPGIPDGLSFLFTIYMVWHHLLIYIRIHTSALRQCIHDSTVESRSRSTQAHAVCNWFWQEISDALTRVNVVENMVVRVTRSIHAQYTYLLICIFMYPQIVQCKTHIAATLLQCVNTGTDTTNHRCIHCHWPYKYWTHGTLISSQAMSHRTNIAM